ncbi:MAG TPA: hypothetical protein VF624_02740 [Tepidisphaeraceae bacterium]|jgi:hypothetical protein
MAKIPQRTAPATPAPPRKRKRTTTEHTKRAVNQPAETQAATPVRAKRPARARPIAAEVPESMPTAGGDVEAASVAGDPSIGIAAILGHLKAHPLASSLASAATVWLAYEGTRRNAPRAVYDASREALGQVGDTLAKAASFAKEEAEEASALAKRSYDGAAKSVRRGAAAVGQGARQGAARGREMAGEVWDNHPLLASLALLAAGVTIGALIPASRLEHTVAGEAAAELLENAKAAGGKAVGRGKRLAANALREGVSAAASEAERVGLSPERVVQKVKRIANRVTTTISSVRDD